MQLTPSRFCMHSDNQINLLRLIFHRLHKSVWNSAFMVYLDWNNNYDNDKIIGKKNPKNMNG